MKEIIAWTVNVWRMYWGNGWIPYLLALGGACARIFGKKKKNSLSLVLYSVFLLVLFFCPFSGRVIMKIIGKIVYWRVLWLLPTVPLIAGGFTELVRRSRNRIVQVILVLVLTGVIAASGTGMIKAGNFERVYNRQQVPDQIAMICNRINEDREGKEVRIAADEYTASYIRVYDPSLKMAYGRRGDGAVGKKARVLYKQITSEVPDGKKTSSLADAVHCTYVVMVPPDENFVLDMVAGGYQVLDTVSPYYIFSCDKYK